MISNKQINYLLAVKATLLIVPTLYLLSKVIFSLIIVFLVCGIGDPLGVSSY